MMLRNTYGLIISLMLVFCAGCWSFRSSHETFDASRVAQDDSVVPVVILGGGCAGLYASVYCAQANIPCLVIEGAKPGGSLSQSHSVRNWPGVVNQPGADIVAGVRRQAEHNGVRIVPEVVTHVDMRSWPRVITTQRADDAHKIQQYKAMAVIIALGTEPNLLDVPGETGSTGYWGRGVSNCAVCEGSLYGGKNVAIVGGGDAAIVEADYMANIAAQVTLLLRGKAFRAKDVVARDRVLARPNVRVRLNTEVAEIKGNGQVVTGLVLKDNVTGGLKDEPFAGLFLAIGSRPNTMLFKGQLALDEHGLIVLGTNQETTVRGVYAAGDVCDGEFMQGATALGDACKAALQARAFLKEIGFDAVSWKDGRNIIKLPVEKHTSTEGHVVEIATLDEFEKTVVRSRKPVVIDLFATWCIPCQQMKPVIEAAAQTLRDSVVFVTMNVQNKALDAQTLIKRLGGTDVQGVPAFLCIDKGQEIGRLVGAMSSEKFIQGVKGIFNIA